MSEPLCRGNLCHSESGIVSGRAAGGGDTAVVQPIREDTGSDGLSLLTAG